MATGPFEGLSSPLQNACAAEREVRLLHGSFALSPPNPKPRQTRVRAVLCEQMLSAGATQDCLSARSTETERWALPRSGTREGKEGRKFD